MATEFGRLLAEVMHSMECGTGFEKLKAVMDIYDYHSKLREHNEVLEDACEILRKQVKRLYEQMYSDDKPMQEISREDERYG